MSAKPRNTKGPGVIYIQSHPAWAKWQHQPTGRIGAVKIGKTGGAAERRAAQIASASGLFVRPKVERTAWVADRGAVERAVHNQLDRFRLSGRREFFAVSIEEAKAVILASTEAREIAPRPAPRRHGGPRRHWRPRVRGRRRAVLVAQAVWWLAVCAAVGFASQHLPWF
jgi:hypothetical protein